MILLHVRRFSGITMYYDFNSYTFTGYAVWAGLVGVLVGVGCTGVYFGIIYAAIAWAGLADMAGY